MAGKGPLSAPCRNVETRKRKEKAQGRDDLCCALINAADALTADPLSDVKFAPFSITKHAIRNRFSKNNHWEIFSYFHFCIMPGPRVFIARLMTSRDISRLFDRFAAVKLPESSHLALAPCTRSSHLRRQPKAPAQSRGSKFPRMDGSLTFDHEGSD